MWESNIPCLIMCLIINYFSIFRILFLHFFISTLLTLKEIDQFYVKNQVEKNIQILHQLAHIEFNAMKAYIDTIYRFGRELNFIQDFAQIAFEEALHF